MSRLTRQSTGALFLALILGSGACTQSRVINRPGTAVEPFQINQSLAGRDAEVRMRNGQLFALYSVELKSDSLFGVAKFGDGSVTQPLSSVLEIRTGKDRWGGGLVGSAIGAGIGALIGFAGYSEAEQGYYGTRGEFAANMAVGGALWGVIIGAIRGNRTKYMVER